MSRSFPAVLAVLACSAAASAGTISAPTLELDGHGVTSFDIVMSGPEVLSGFELYVQINDGYSGPLITSAKLVDYGHVFDPSNSSEMVIIPPPGWRYGASVVTSSGLVAATGVLATITIDTTGVPDGDYPILLGIPEFDLWTNYGPGWTEPMLVNGMIHLVPEPAALALLALAGLFIRRARA